MRRVVELSSILLASCLCAQSGYWEQLPAGGVPAADPAWSPSRMCFDEQRGVAVLVTTHAQHVNTWEFANGTWQLRASYLDPSGGFAWISDLVWDPGRQRVVTASTVGPLCYLSAWDGVDWHAFATLRLAGGVPTMPIGLAFDPDHATYVMVCVVDGNLQTVVFDGTSFTVAGPGVMTHSMVWDAPRHRITAIVHVSSDTCTLVAWDGSQWSTVVQIPTDSGNLVADPSHGRILGIVNGLVVHWGQWDGTSISQVFVYAGVMPPLGILARDPLDGSILLWSTNPDHVSAWRYREVAPSAFTVTGAGCAGPVGTPSLAPAAGPPVLGQPFRMRLQNVAAGSLVLGFTGIGTQVWNGNPLPFSLTPWGAPGCSVWLDPISAVPFVAGNDWNIAWSSDPVFAGLQFHVQADVLTPGWNALGIVVSNAGMCRVGVR